MNKAEAIAKHLAKPIEIGDRIVVDAPYVEMVSTKVGRKYVDVSTPKKFSTGGIVLSIVNDEHHGILYEIDTYTRFPKELQIYSHGYKKLVKAEFVKQDTWQCGANPMKERVRLNQLPNDIQSLLFNGRYGRKTENFSQPELEVVENVSDKEKDVIGKLYGGIDFNPYVVGEDGNKMYYQRPFVWTVEDKQLLIHSIYNGIEIGKFVFKYNSWGRMVNQMRSHGRGYDFDCIDGKQRYHAILDFIRGKFPDEFGNYWNDLSEEAQRKFMNYSNMTVCSLGEKATDKEILATFLTVNFTGTPMSREHIEYVKSIKL